jgi:hypothetical protein
MRCRYRPLLGLGGVLPSQPVRMPTGTRSAIMAAVLAVLTLAGCQGDATPDTQWARSTELDATVSLEAVPGPKPEGRFFAVLSAAGPNDDQLYEFRFSPPELRRLSPIRRVSAVGACKTQVVVTTAQEDIDFTDQLQELKGQEFVPLEGLGPVVALAPAVGPDCRVAYTVVDRTGPVTTAELRTWDPARKEGKTLFRTRPGDGTLLGASWGPKGEVAVLRMAPEAPDPPAPGPPGKGRPAAVIVVRPNGSSFELDPGTLDPVGVAWGKTMIAIGDGEARTILLRPTGGKRITVEAWRPLSWSPDGTALLVSDAPTGRVIGLLDPDTASVKEVGRLTGSVFDVDWLPAK